MMWKVPRIWEGGDVWIIGGGPSMPKQFGVPEGVIKQVSDGTLPPSAYSPYMKDIHKCHVIAINMAYKIGNWIDMVLFGDNGFYLHERKELADFPGLKISCHPNNDHDSWVKFLARDTSHTTGISSNPHMVSWNQNTGSAAISLAAHTGAKRIILLGFDMKLADNKMQHWHNLYQKGPVDPNDKRRIRKLPFARHLAGFSVIAEDAKKMHIEILNACPDSAIECFPKFTVNQLLHDNT